MAAEAGNPVTCSYQHLSRDVAKETWIRNSAGGLRGHILSCMTCLDASMLPECSNRFDCERCAMAARPEVHRY